MPIGPLSPPDAGTLTTLAQLGLFGGNDIAPLPDAPAIERFVLANPWPAVVVCLALGAVVGATLHSRGKSLAAGLSVAAGVLLAAAAFGLERFVQTDREALRADTRLFVDAAAAGDSARAAAYLARVVQVDSPVIRGDRDGLLVAIDTLPARYVRTHRVTDVQAALDGPGSARTQFRVWAEGGEGAGESVWLLDWRRELAGTGSADHGPWRIAGVEMLFAPGL